MKDKYFVMDKEFVNDCITFVLTFKRLLARIETMDIDNAKTVDEVEFHDLKYYRTKNIPAKGCFIRPEDTGNEQLTLFDE